MNEGVGEAGVREAPANPWEVNTNPITPLKWCPKCRKPLGSLQVGTGGVNPWTFGRRYQVVSPFSSLPGLNGF
jgi:hypothetical protein